LPNKELDAVSPLAIARSLNIGTFDLRSDEVEFTILIKNLYTSLCDETSLTQTSHVRCRVWEQLKRRSSFQVLPTMDNQRKNNGATKELNHPAFQNIRICLVSDFDIVARDSRH